MYQTPRKCLREYLTNEIPKLHYKQALAVTMHTNALAMLCCNALLSDETLFSFARIHARILLSESQRAF